MSERIEVALAIEGRTAHDAEAAAAEIRSLAARCGEPAWAILQSFPKISFKRWADDLSSLKLVFTGRIFGPEAEVRWAREGSEWQIWCIQDSPGQPATHRRAARRYYLWDHTDRNRIPGVGSLPEVPRGKDEKPYILVYEYEAILTDWSSLTAIEDHLNQPRLSAHRFVELAAGVGAEEE